MAEETVAVFSLDCNLSDRRVVHADSHSLDTVVFVSHFLSAGGIGVVVFVAAEEIKLLLVAQTAYLREYVVASLKTYRVGVACDRRVL